MSGWYGVDLDGTLAMHEGATSHTDIGDPIPKMVSRVKRWLKNGRQVKIVTARVANAHQRAAATAAIKAWCKEHIGQELPVTASKDYLMVELWDDRAVQVRRDTGEPVDVTRRGRD